jgi:hypothetical protein
MTTRARACLPALTAFLPNQDDPWCQANPLQSEFIEVFATDILQFPDATLKAHIELHRSPAASP